tara:strand:- start:283 stop:492 length:210 start_codon:yes stop_codon:yes gene_type:complete
MEANIASFKVVITQKNIFVAETSVLPLNKVNTVFKDVDAQRRVKTIVRESTAAFAALHKRLEKELSALT